MAWALATVCQLESFFVKWIQIQRKTGGGKIDGKAGRGWRGKRSGGYPGSC